MKITMDDVRHVAELAHLELSPDEANSLRRELDAILTYIDKLNELDTSQVAPLDQVAGIEAGPAPIRPSLREDVPRSSDVAAVALDSAPDPAPPYFRVPKVIER